MAEQTVFPPTPKPTVEQPAARSTTVPPVPKSAVVQLVSKSTKLMIPKLGLKFRNGRCQVSSARAAELAKTPYWNLQFGKLGEFNPGPEKEPVKVLRGEGVSTMNTGIGQPPPLVE